MVLQPRNFKGGTIMSKSKNLRIALTKGRLEKDTVGLFEKIGFDVSQLKDKGRKLILSIPGQNIEVVLAKAADVITYVEHGACDIGVVGRDTILEYGGKYFEIADLGFGRCKFALAVKKGSDFYGGYGVKTVATKYTNVTRSFFEQKKIRKAQKKNNMLILSNGKELIKKYKINEYYDKENDTWEKF